MIKANEYYRTGAGLKVLALEPLGPAGTQWRVYGGGELTTVGAAGLTPWAEVSRQEHTHWAWLYGDGLSPAVAVAFAPPSPDDRAGKPPHRLVVGARRVHLTLEAGQWE